MLGGMGDVVSAKIRGVLERVQERLNEDSIDIDVPQEHKSQQPKAQSGPQGIRSGIPSAPQGMSFGQMMGSPASQPFSPMMGPDMLMGPQAMGLAQQRGGMEEFARLTQQTQVGPTGAPIPLDTGFEGTESVLRDMLTDEAQAMIEAQVRDHVSLVFSQEMKKG